jgi:glycosyltransferase involved in cell wall biosynthesis
MNVPLNVGFIGRLVAQKQPTVFVELAAEVLRHVPEARFYMLGDGPLYKTVRQRIARLHLEESVRLAGEASEAGIFHELQQTSVLAAPSLWEGLPLVGLEAMSCGVPVVASATSGWNELIRDGLDGYLDEQGNVAQFVERVLFILLHPQERQRLAVQCRNRVLEGYTLDQAVDRYMDLYASLSDH